MQTTAKSFTFFCVRPINHQWAAPIERQSKSLLCISLSFIFAIAFDSIWPITTIECQMYIKKERKKDLCKEEKDRKSHPRLAEAEKGNWNVENVNCCRPLEWMPTSTIKAKSVSLLSARNSWQFRFFFLLQSWSIRETDYQESSWRKQSKLWTGTSRLLPLLCVNLDAAMP